MMAWLNDAVRIAGGRKQIIGKKICKKKSHKKLEGGNWEPRRGPLDDRSTWVPATSGNFPL